MLIVYMFILNLLICFSSVNSQLLSYKSDTCTRFFIQSVLLQSLEAALVLMNNKCIPGLASDNL